MTDTIETLADEYWTAYLADNPTEAHLLGDYRRAATVRGRLAVRRRTGTSRPSATSPRRAEAIDAGGPSTSSSRSPGWCWSPTRPRGPTCWRPG